MKAVALFSGGLDSTLAMKLIIEQGIEVIALNVNIGFGAVKSKKPHLENMCQQIGAKLRIADVQDKYVQEILFNAEHGYGKRFNPCVDCHGFMFRLAKKIMEEEGASFLISGEVLGQRPMSQNPRALSKVLEISDCDGLLLRPMCAQNMPETIPEKEGWVDRSKLLKLSGRSRTTQLELAEKFGLKDYETPGGGCLLTDESFALKIQDFADNDDFTAKDIPVIKHGRQMRLPNGAKLTVGRNQEDNEAMQAIENDKFFHVKTVGIPGPHSLLSKTADAEDKALAMSIILAYTKAEFGKEYELDIEGESLTSTPLESKEAANAYNIFELKTFRKLS